LFVCLFVCFASAQVPTDYFYRWPAYTLGPHTRAKYLQLHHHQVMKMEAAAQRAHFEWWLYEQHKAHLAATTAIAR
jgi:hypothetical protein